MSLKSPISFQETTSCLTKNLKDEPLPYSLSTISFVSIKARSLRTILIPRPVPSIVLFLISSILSNGEYSFAISLSLIPIPVSLTSKWSVIEFSSFFSNDTLKATVPLSVYLTALVSRFVTTCFNLISSPISIEGI